MKDATIAAAINKHVDPRFFQVGHMLHSFEQNQPTHAQKLQFVSCLNAIRKNHVKIQNTRDHQEAYRIMLDTKKHAAVLDSLEGVIY